MGSIFDEDFDYEKGYAFHTVGRIAIYKTDQAGHILTEKSILIKDSDTSKAMTMLSDEIKKRVEKDKDFGTVLYSNENGIDMQISNHDEYFRVRPLTSIVSPIEYEAIPDFQTELSSPLLLTGK